VAYELHLVRDGGIDLAEWRSLISSVDGVREAAADWVTKLPRGQELRVKVSPGDAEVLVEPGRLWRIFGAKPAWYPFFRYRNGRVNFKAAFEVDNPEDRRRRLIALLASRLGAQVQGDDGEVYEF